MKKLIIFVLIPIVLAGCTVQEKVNSEIFLGRLTGVDKNINVEKTFRTEENYVAFISYGGADFVIKTAEDECFNVTSVSLTCADGKKNETFRNLVKNIVTTYCNDDTEEVINGLSDDGNNKDFRFFSTKWYRYSAVINENGLYFSLENLKLTGETEEQLSLEHKKGAVSPKR